MDLRKQLQEAQTRNVDLQSKNERVNAFAMQLAMKLKVSHPAIPAVHFNSSSHLHRLDVLYHDAYLSFDSPTDFSFSLSHDFDRLLSLF